MKSVSFNLFPALIDLSIWGCYKINNEGFLELCTAHKSENFRRVNYCGCYKISDDSRLWISSSFSRVIIYNKVDDFGKDLDYNECLIWFIYIKLNSDLLFHTRLVRHCYKFEYISNYVFSKLSMCFFF